MPGGEGAGALPNSSADTSNVRGALFALPPHQEPEAVQVATLLTVVGAEARKVFATFTDWASDTDQNKIHLCYKSLQRTVSHLKMCLLKDISFILECKNRESLTITIRQLFDS